MIKLARGLAPLAIAAALAVPAAAAAQTTPTTLHVVGHGRAFVKPDMATIGITVTRAASTRELARAHANQVTARIVAGLVRIGIKRTDIQTSNITLDTTTVPSGHHRHRTVYQAEIDLTVTTTRIDLLSALFETASRAGATSFSGPNFGFSDPSAGLSQATDAALRDARRRADAAAADLGMVVIGVQSVDLDPSSTVAPVVGAPTAGAKGTPSSTTPVLPGRMEVDADVDVVYLLGSQ